MHTAATISALSQLGAELTPEQRAKHAEVAIVALEVRLKEANAQLALARQRVTTLLDALPGDAAARALERVSSHNFTPLTNAEAAGVLITQRTLPPPLPIVRRSVKQALLADARTAETSAAVNAGAAKLTLDEKKSRVLERALRILAASGTSLAAMTPGFASGKYWLPGAGRPTSGSAAYSRYNVKYYALGHQTLVPLYIDERDVTSREIWQQRKQEALEIEKHLHTALSQHAVHGRFYEGQEGGAEPKYSATTHFFVYLAVRES